MQHVDPDVLALLALGEDAASADERRHLTECALCTDELAELADVALTGRSVTPEDALVAPAPAVWDRISAELGLGAAPSAAAPLPAPAADAADDPAGREDAPATAATLGPPPARVASLAERRATRERRGGRFLPALVAACLALGLGVTAGVLWERRSSAPAETLIANARLDALPDWPDASGKARIEQGAAGQRQVVVDLDAPASADGFREVWLIAGDLSGLVSLGVLEGAEGRFDIPAGLDLDKFSLVDVSEEHLDGDPAHSGDSIVRGALENRA